MSRSVIVSAKETLKKMFSGTSHSTGKALHPMFEVVQIQFDWPQVFQTPMKSRSCDKADSADNETTNELATLFDEVTDAYERAVQALRDLRHLLPPEGVAIVDAVLR
jgi:hypothetical protein